MRAFTTLRVDIAAGVAEVVLNRPKKLNSMTPAFFSELEEAAVLVKDHPDVRVVLLRGEGRAFTAGLDLSESTPALSCQQSNVRSHTHPSSHQAVSARWAEQRPLPRTRPPHSCASCSATRSPS